VAGLLLFVLPDGRSAEVAVPSARLICDRLWGLGVEAGAVTAATRLSEALHTEPAFGTEVVFTERELTPLISATQVHPPTWASLLLQTANVTAIPPAKRRRLLATCENLLASLSYDDDHYKVSALIGDLQRLRDDLRAGG
jgi:hypothetical protein